MTHSDDRRNALNREYELFVACGRHEQKARTRLTLKCRRCERKFLRVVDLSEPVLLISYPTSPEPPQGLGASERATWSASHLDGGKQATMRPLYNDLEKALTGTGSNGLTLHAMCRCFAWDIDRSFLDEQISEGKRTKVIDPRTWTQ